jgi:hypothetical protein
MTDIHRWKETMPALIGAICSLDDPEFDSDSFDAAQESLMKLAAWADRMNDKAEDEKDFKINTELVLSTEHISLDCNDALTAATRGLYYNDDDPLIQISIYDHHFGFGYLLHAYGADLPETTNFPELDALLKKAVDLKCKWLTLDCDGPINKEFPTFDW